MDGNLEISRALKSVTEHIKASSQRVSVIMSRNSINHCWRRLHNEELHNVYFSPNTIGVIKSRRME